MKRILLIACLGLITVQPASAQRSVGIGVAPGVSPYTSPYGSPYGTNPYSNAYGQQYNPYNTVNPYNRGVSNTVIYGSGIAPVYGTPQPLGNGFYGIPGGANTFNMWRGPSGYYYPWAYSPAAVYAPTINVINGASQPALPPLSTEFSDIMKYMDEQKDKGKLTDGDYNHLKQRALDLLSKERDLRSQSGGSLDADAERDIRSGIDGLGSEMARRVKL